VHGILPDALTRSGLVAGVKELASRVRTPVTVRVPQERFPLEIEGTAYFVIAEALTNVTKHARAGNVEVSAWMADDALHLEVRDDGVGGARTDGSGLRGLSDRVGALGGQLSVHSPAGEGTRVAAMLPLRG
jgi:signal transduction histidine kinase